MVLLFDKFIISYRSKKNLTSNNLFPSSLSALGRSSGNELASFPFRPWAVLGKRACEFPDSLLWPLFMAKLIGFALRGLARQMEYFMSNLVKLLMVLLELAKILKDSDNDGRPDLFDSDPSNPEVK